MAGQPLSLQIGACIALGLFLVSFAVAFAAMADFIGRAGVMTRKDKDGEMSYGVRAAKGVDNAGRIFTDPEFRSHRRLVFIGFGGCLLSFALLGFLTFLFKV